MYQVHQFHMGKVMNIATTFYSSYTYIYVIFNKQVIIIIRDKCFEVIVYVRYLSLFSVSSPKIENFQ